MRIPSATFTATNDGDLKTAIVVRCDHVSAIEELALRPGAVKDTIGMDWPTETRTLIYLVGGRIVGVTESCWDVVNAVHSALQAV